MSKQNEEDIKKEYELKQRLWLKKEGFNDDGYTYIVKGETYSIKDELKDAGFRFNPTLMWHQGQVPAGYEDRVVCFYYTDLLEFSAWGEGHYLPETKGKIKELVQPKEEIISTDWLEEDKFSNLLVTFIRKYGFSGKYGWTNVFTFQTEDNKILTWFTSTSPDIKLGDSLFISGSVKERTIYKEAKNTIVTRVKIK